MGILGGLKAIAAGMTGKKVVLELPKDIDTSAIMAAMVESRDFVWAYTEENPGMLIKAVTNFILSQKLNGKDVKLRITIDDIAGEEDPDVSVTLIVPMNQKETDSFIKRYKKLRNLSVLTKIPFSLDGETEWYFIPEEGGILTDLLNQMGVKSTAVWKKVDIEYTTSSSESF